MKPENQSAGQSDSFDVVVVGGGHAGTEAAAAAARLGARTALITLDFASIGAMSCNPAIGGLGKGHLVREIDAFDGLMARAADAAGIQFRVLNRSKGPAVRGPRAQADRTLYKKAIQSFLLDEENLTIIEGMANKIIFSKEKSHVTGIELANGKIIGADSVVLTTGTFLNGLIHIGKTRIPAGRIGEAPAIALSESLSGLGFTLGRLKTGTPPRLDGRSIDFSKCTVQPGDGMPGGEGDSVPVFSFMGAGIAHPQQVPCWITHTNERTHEIIRSGFDRSPMFTGKIEGVGPRYCPSVEDKINRFADKDSHQIFLEPEGLTTHEVYPNGISTSLPYDVQVEFVRSIRGLENAHITRPGYAIEYDYFDPRDLQGSLETKVIEGLFFAGQINGTTGYEEAGAQGIVAGINAARRVRGEAPWVPSRAEAYLGVLIDDLITRGASEPYRMFTSRAEHRLLLREDNADLRLTETGRQMGLIDEERWSLFCRKRDATEADLARLHKARWRGTTAFDLLRRPEVSYDDLSRLAVESLGDMAQEFIAHNPMSALAALDDRLPEAVRLQLEVRAKYSGYIERQQDEIERQRKHESLPLPTDLDYHSVVGLSNEVRQRLSEQRPDTLGQASRLPGITPAAVSVLLIHLKRRSA